MTCQNACGKLATSRISCTARARTTSETASAFLDELGSSGEGGMMRIPLRTRSAAHRAEVDILQRVLARQVPALRGAARGRRARGGGGGGGGGRPERVAAARVRVGAIRIVHVAASAARVRVDHDERAPPRAGRELERGAYDRYFSVVERLDPRVLASRHTSNARRPTATTAPAKGSM